MYEWITRRPRSLTWREIMIGAMSPFGVTLTAMYAAAWYLAVKIWPLL